MSAISRPSRTRAGRVAYSVAVLVLASTVAYWAANGLAYVGMDLLYAGLFAAVAPGIFLRGG